MARPPRRRAGAPRSLVPPPTTAAVSAAWSQRLVARMNLLSPLLVPLLCTAVAYAAVVALGRGNYTDPYYATAVQSMLHNWHNFIFLSFDRAGFLSVDKPPVDLWLQTLSARILGLGDTSLVLPQALAGGLSVGVLYLSVRRDLGESVARLAALTFAVTPIFMATNRSNSMDSVLVLLVLLAGWAVSIACDSRRVAPVLVAAALLGLAFNVTWLFGFLVIPAFVATYMRFACVTLRSRLVRLGLAGLVLGFVSLSWATAVDSIPASQRPHVASSTKNSEIDLALGYYGLGRLSSANGVATAFAGAIGDSGGPAGPFRLLDEQLGGQAGWLLVLTLAGMGLGLARVGQAADGRPTDRWASPVENGSTAGLPRALLLWGGWFGTLGLVFSFSGFIHPYYLVLLAPATSVLAALGVVSLWHEYHRPRGAAWLLPGVLPLAAAVEAAIVYQSPDWNRWLAPFVVIVCAAASIVLYIGRPVSRRGQHAASRSPMPATVAITMSIGSLLLAPLLWTSVPIWHFGNAELPVAGPDLLDASLQPVSASEAYLAPSSLIRFLETRHGGERFILAARYGGVASPVMLATAQAVLDYGGYLGEDSVVDADTIASMVAGQEVRYFWQLPAQANDSRPSSVEAWVRDRCALVPGSQWQPPHLYGASAPQLFDCRRTRPAR